MNNVHNKFMLLDQCWKVGNCDIDFFLSFAVTFKWQGQNLHNSKVAEMPQKNFQSI